MESLFRAEAVRDARYRLDGALIIAQPLSTALGVAIIAALLAMAAWYLSAYEYRRSETVAGFVTTSDGIVALAATRGGTLLRRHVQVGDTVNAGDALFECSTDIDSVHGGTAASQLVAIERGLAELDKLTGVIQQSYSSQQRDLELRRSSLRQRLQLLARQFRSRKELAAVAMRQLSRLKSLRDKQFVSENDVVRQTESLLAQRSELLAVELQVADTRNEIHRLDLEQQRLPHQLEKELAELAIRRNALLGTQIEQHTRSSYIVRAPVDGRVTAIQGSMGQQLTPAEPVVTLAPADSQLVVNLLAPSRTVGFLAANDSVELHVDAFPYQKFGALHGHVSDISRSAFKPGDLRTPIPYRDAVYKVVVALDRDYVLGDDAKHPLQIDMTLTGRIAIERRSLVQWIFEPLLSLRS